MYNIAVTDDLTKYVADPSCLFVKQAKEIGKTKRPSQWKLEQEGWAIYDEQGRDTGHWCYGGTRPDLTERNLQGNSEATKQKISDNHADVSGEKNPMYNKNHSQKSLKKMSENRKGKGTAPRSAEARENIRQGALRRWARAN